MLRLKIPAILTRPGHPGSYMDLTVTESPHSVDSTRDLELWFFDLNQSVSTEDIARFFPDCHLEHGTISVHTAIDNRPWQLFLEAMKHLMGSAWIHHQIVRCGDAFLHLNLDYHPEDEDFLLDMRLHMYMTMDYLILQPYFRKNTLIPLNHEILKRLKQHAVEESHIFLSPNGSSATLRWDLSCIQDDGLVKSFESVFGPFESLFSKELPRWMVVAQGSVLYRYPSCLIFVSSQTGSSLSTNEFLRESSLRPISEEMLIFSAEAEKLFSAPSTTLTPQPFQETSTNPSDTPKNDSKLGDTPYSTSSMADYDHLGGFNTSFSMSQRLETENTEDLNLDDVADVDFDFFSNPGPKVKSEGLKSVMSPQDFVSPMSVASTPELGGSSNPFSPNVPFTPNLTNQPISPMLNVSPASKQDDVYSEPEMTCEQVSNVLAPSPSAYAPITIHGKVIASQGSDMPDQWMPFEFEAHGMEKYGNEEAYKYSPSPAKAVEEIKIENEGSDEISDGMMSDQSSVCEQYFTVGDLLDLLTFDGTAPTARQDPTLQDQNALEDYDSIRFLALSLQHVNTFLQSSSLLSVPKFQISDATETRLLEFMGLCLSALFGNALEAKAPLNIQQYYDLQEMDKVTSAKYGKFKKKRKAVDPVLELLPSRIVLRVDSQTVSTDSSILQFWDRMPITPISGSKNVLWWGICPADGPLRSQEVERWIRKTSQTWNSLNLGGSHVMPLMKVPLPAVDPLMQRDTYRMSVLSDYRSVLDQMVKEAFDRFHKDAITDEFIIFTLVYPNLTISQQDGYELFAYFLWKIALLVNKPVDALKTVYLVNLATVGELSTLDMDTLSLHQKLFALYNQCRHPDEPFQPLYMIPKNNPLQPCFLERADFEDACVFRDSEHTLFVHLQEFEQGFHIVWADSLLESMEFKSVQSLSTCADTVDHIWNLTMDRLLNQQDCWNVVIVYQSKITAQILKAWRMIWEPLVSQPHTPQESLMGTESSVSSTMACSPCEPADQPPQLFVSLSVVTLCERELRVFKSEEWYGWYTQAHGSLIKPQGARWQDQRSWMYMSNHAIPVNGHSPLASGCVGRWRWNLMIGIELDKGHRLSGYRRLREILKSCVF